MSCNVLVRACADYCLSKRQIWPWKRELSLLLLEGSWGKKYIALQNMDSFKIIFLVLLFLQVIHHYESKVVQGYLRTGENWAFLTRFCFLSVHGQFKYEVTYMTEYGVQNLNLYYDSPTQWERVYGKHSNMKSCREKESVLQVRLSTLFWYKYETTHSSTYTSILKFRFFMS